MIPKCYELVWLVGSWKQTLLLSFHVFSTLTSWPTFTLMQVEQESWIVKESLPPLTTSKILITNSPHSQPCQGPHRFVPGEFTVMLKAQLLDILLFQFWLSFYKTFHDISFCFNCIIALESVFVDHSLTSLFFLSFHYIWRFWYVTLMLSLEMSFNVFYLCFVKNGKIGKNTYKIQPTPLKDTL